MSTGGLETGNVYCMDALKAPYPYFGGKSRIAPVVWKRLGNVPNYVEPFLGSAAMVLARPAEHLDGTQTETANDKDGMVSNFWRALQTDPEAVARYADWPAIENDLHARHSWLVGQKDNLTTRLEGDPDYYDAKIAGWWVWGMSLWIGSGFCSGDGSWVVADGELVKRGDAGRGIQRQSLHLGDAGMGVQRKSLGDGLYAYFEALAARFKRVRVNSGDWTRVMGESVTTKHGLTGVFLDPPYIMDDRTETYNHDSGDIAADVRAWAISNGDNPLFRIAYCGYEDEDVFPASWQCVKWTQAGGYDVQRKNGTNGNRQREKVWFSPHCVKPVHEVQKALFT